MTHREIMQQALDALEYQVKQTRPIEQTSIAITALREALAKPEQEVDYWIRQYSAARDAEMKLRRELEALAQPEREPAAYMYDFEIDGEVVRDWLTTDHDEARNPAAVHFNIRPLYAAPTAAALVHEYRKGFIEGQIDMRDRPEEQRTPLTHHEIVPMLRRRIDMEVSGEKSEWFWYAWGVTDAEAHHGIKGQP